MKQCTWCDDYVTDEGTCGEFYCPMELEDGSRDTEPLDFNDNSRREIEYVPDIGEVEE